MLDSRAVSRSNNYGPAKKFELRHSITKPKRTVGELFFRPKYSCMNSAVSILIIRHCIFI